MNANDNHKILRRREFSAETQSFCFFDPLGALRGHEKKFKNYQNRKICLNEIKCLHVLILVKRDFFSRPAVRCEFRAVGATDWSTLRPNPSYCTTKRTKHPARLRRNRTRNNSRKGAETQRIKEIDLPNFAPWRLGEKHPHPALSGKTCARRENFKHSSTKSSGFMTPSISYLRALWVLRGEMSLAILVAALPRWVPHVEDYFVD